jgi:hypothetical protein
MLPALQVLQDVVDSDDDDDDDDYFHSEASLPCIPDVPDNLKSESDSIDLDELPCIVPESMMPERAADTALEVPMRKLNEDTPRSIQRATSTATRLPAAAASITRSGLHAFRLQAAFILHLSAVDRIPYRIVTQISANYDVRPVCACSRRGSGWPQRCSVGQSTPTKSSGCNQHVHLRSSRQAQGPWR